MPDTNSNNSGSGGAGLVGAIGGWVSQFAQNVYNRNESRRAESFDRWGSQMERMHANMALTDQRYYDQKLWEQQNAYNEMMWNKANAYNSPMAQMQRYKEAGLNPALIYGQSNTAPAIQSAQQPSAGSGDVISNKPSRAFEADFGGFIQNSIANYYGIRSQSNALKMQEQQIMEQQLKNDLLAANVPWLKDSVKYDSQNKYYEMFNRGEEMNAKMSIPDYYKKSMSLPQKMLSAQFGLLNSELKFADETNEAKSGILQQTWEEIKAKAVNREQRVQLEQIENDLKMNGVYPGDAIYWRIATSILQKLGIVKDIGSFLNTGKNILPHFNKPTDGFKK